MSVMKCLSNIVCRLSPSSSSSSWSMLASLLSSEFPSHLLGPITWTQILPATTDDDHPVDFRVLVCFESGSLLVLGYNIEEHRLKVLQSLDLELTKVKSVEIGVDYHGNNFFVLNYEDVCALVQMERSENRLFISHEFSMEKQSLGLLDAHLHADGHQLLRHEVEDVVYRAEVVDDDELRWESLDVNQYSNDDNESDNVMTKRLKDNVASVLASNYLSVHNLVQKATHDVLDLRHKMRTFFNNGIEASLGANDLLRRFYNYDHNKEDCEDVAPSLQLTAVQSALSTSKLFLRLTLSSKHAITHLHVQPLLKGSTNSAVTVKKTLDKFGDIDVDMVIDLDSLLMHIDENHVSLRLTISFSADHRRYQQVISDPRLNVRLNVEHKEDNVYDMDPLPDHCFNNNVHLKAISGYSLTRLPNLLEQLGFSRRSNSEEASNKASSRPFVHSGLRVCCVIDDDFRGLTFMGDEESAMRLCIANLNEFLPPYVFFTERDNSDDQHRNEDDDVKDDGDSSSSSVTCAKQALVEELSLLITAMENHVVTDDDNDSDEDIITMTKVEFGSLMHRLLELELESDRRVMQVVAQQPLL